MADDEKDHRDDWRYILRLEYEGTTVWLECRRLPGMPEGTARIKVGGGYYFLDSVLGGLFFNTDTETMICFMNIRESVGVGDGVEIGANGAINPEKAKIDVHAFIEDDRFKQLEKPF